MADLERYINEWEAAIKEASEAMKNGDTGAADAAMEKAEELYSKYRQAANEEDRMNNANFGVLNDVLESKLAVLLMKEPSVAGKCLKLIKEDKNLLSLAKFYSAMDKYDGTSSARVFVTEALDLTSKNIDRKTIKASKIKLSKLMRKSGLPIEESEDTERTKYINACEYLIENGRKLSNINESTRSVEVVANYIESHVKDNKPAVDIYEECDKFDDSLKQLNESERELVNDILSAKKKCDEEKHRKLFEKYKSECLKYIDRLMTENEGNDKLLEIRKQIEGKVFDESKIVGDIAKFLEIGGILSA